MAPARDSIDRTAEYEDFIEKLRLFHQQRGTSFEPAPRIGNHKVDLLQLYKRITSEGGYDKVSDKINNKLAWRKIGEDFGLADSNLAALAFTLKTVYYKNVVAYEIKHFHKTDPPPKEILEHISAKGGNVLSRSLDNFKRPSMSEPAANGTDSPAEPEAEDSSISGRASRGLRQAPPQRQLFQSDTSTSRNMRPNNHQQFSPTPVPAGSGPPSNTSHHMADIPPALTNYEPRPTLPLSLRPVSTPGTNYDGFKNEQKKIRDAALAERFPNDFTTPKGMMLPGIGFQGQNIYARCLLALQSGVLDEQEYALYHLVKISHERGDKYRFDGFPGLAETLMHQILDISNLITGVEYEISYRRNETLVPKPNSINTSKPETRYISRNTAKKRKFDDMMQPEMYARRLNLVNEAGLVLRNMVMLKENAEFISRFPTSRELLLVLLTLPQSPQVTEVQHYALEIAEQLTSYFLPEPNDAFFRALMVFVRSTDRGTILPSIRAICRLGSHYSVSAQLQDVPVEDVRRLCDYLLIEDEELRTASLDFLYQYTAVPDNVEHLLQHVDVDGFIRQLVRLLLHTARVEEERRPVSRNLTSRHSTTASVGAFDDDDENEERPIPRVPLDLIEQLLGYDEPERSSQWLRSCFYEEPNGEITQIALWQAYQVPFTQYSSQRPLLPAKDFITNVSTTFAGASAQVRGQAPNNKFIIKGIRPRKMPNDPKGRSYMRCLWRVPEQANGVAVPVAKAEGSEQADELNGMAVDMTPKVTWRECGEFALWPKQMWEHVVERHLHVPKTEDGKWNLAAAPTQAETNGSYTGDGADTKLSCRWADCERFKHAQGRVTAFDLGVHLKTHLPDSSERAYYRSKHNQAATQSQSQSQSLAQSRQHSLQGSVAGGPSESTTSVSSWQQHNTTRDEHGGPTGLPLTAILVLRNLARNIPRTASAARLQQETEGAEGAAALLEKCFAGVRDQLYFIFAHNETLGAYLVSLVRALDGRAIVGD